MAHIFLTASGTFTAPAGWPGAADKIELVGPGGTGGLRSSASIAGAGGGSGGYTATALNAGTFTISGGSSYTVGTSGSGTATSITVSGQTITANAGGNATTATGGTAGAAVTVTGIISLARAGTAAGNNATSSGTGGAGAPGPSGVGAANSTTTGGTGDNATVNGGAAGAAGSVGKEWAGSWGVGGGAGGASGTGNAPSNAGRYGAGGGGHGTATGGTAGVAGGGLIVITYTPTTVVTAPSAVATIHPPFTGIIARQPTNFAGSGAVVALATVPSHVAYQGSGAYSGLGSLAGKSVTQTYPLLSISGAATLRSTGVAIRHASAAYSATATLSGVWAARRPAIAVLSGAATVSVFATVPAQKNIYAGLAVLSGLGSMISRPVARTFLTLPFIGAASFRTTIIALRPTRASLSATGSFIGAAARGPKYGRALVTGSGSLFVQSVSRINVRVLFSAIAGVRFYPVNVTARPLPQFSGAGAIAANGIVPSQQPTMPIRNWVRLH